MKSRDNLLDLLDKVPGSSLTVFTSTIGMGIGNDEHLVIEDSFDNTRLFVDVHVRSMNNVYDRTRANCAIM